MPVLNLSLMNVQRREAFSRNEKSRHEPGSMTRHRCQSGCGCGSAKTKPGGQAKRTVDLGAMGKFQEQRKSKRPWMLGH